MIIYPDQNRLKFAIALRLVYFPFPWWTDRTSTCDGCEQVRQRIAAARFKRRWFQERGLDGIADELLAKARAAR